MTSSSRTATTGAGAVTGGVVGGTATGAAFGATALPVIPPLGVITVLGGALAGAAAVILCASIPMMSGCAAIATVEGVALTVSALPSNEAPRWVETNRLTFVYPVEIVYKYRAWNAMVARSSSATRTLGLSLCLILFLG
jgi:hypothetical protein